MLRNAQLDALLENKRDLLPELVAFVVTFISAIVFRWDARDIIWGLWISSLCVGYAFIVAARSSIS